VRKQDGKSFVDIEMHIDNVDQGRVTTEGTATVIFAESGPAILDALALRQGGATLAPIDSIADPEVPSGVRERVGTEIERVTSYCPVELGRLRLFAEAIMGIRPIHYDPAAAASSA